MNRSTLGILLFAFVSLPATPALAEPPAASAPARAGLERGYLYVFDDEPLTAGGLDAHDARIRVVRPPFRSPLLRLRASFVTEMLVSVEKL